MRIAIVNETSAADKNADILAALAGRGHEILNVGMKKSGEQPELQYIHTGFLSALLLNLEIADLVVGGCGTGIGYMNSVMQYPGVVCGLINHTSGCVVIRSDKRWQLHLTGIKPGIWLG